MTSSYNQSQLTSNKQVLSETRRVQGKTRESLLRIQQQAAETKVLGEETLAELQSQRNTLQKIETESHKLNAHLTKTSQLQNTFDRWAFKIGGRDKRQAKQEATLEASLKKKEKENASNKPNYTMPSSTNNKMKKKKKDVLHAVSENTGKDGSFAQQLDDEDRATLQRIESEDDEINEMLDAADLALDRLDFLASSINQEATSHSKQIDTNDALIEKAHTKQHVINGRLKRALGIRSKKKADANNSSK